VNNPGYSSVPFFLLFCEKSCYKINITRCKRKIPMIGERGMAKKEKKDTFAYKRAEKRSGLERRKEDRRKDEQRKAKRRKE
jgi:hypothetical protein